MKKFFSFPLLFIFIINTFTYAYASHGTPQFSTFSYIAYISPGWHQASFTEEEVSIGILIGTNQVQNPCNQSARLISDRITDIITPTEAPVDCHTGRVDFKVKANQAGVSNFTIHIEDKKIPLGSFRFFIKKSNGSLIRSIGHSEVFFVQGNKIYKIESPEVFESFGFQWDSIIDVSQAEEFAYDNVVVYSSEQIWNFILQEGSVISSYKYDKDPDVFTINQEGYKRLFLNPTTIFNFYKHLQRVLIRQVPPSIKDKYITSNFYKNCETKNPGIYIIEKTNEDEGILHLINMSLQDAIAQESNLLDKTFCINDREFNWYKKGSSLSSIIN